MLRRSNPDNYAAMQNIAKNNSRSKKKRKVFQCKLVAPKAVNIAALQKIKC